MPGIEQCKIIEMNKIIRPQGNLTVISGHDEIPFAINRVYYLYDIPGGSQRGGHAHRQLQQLIVAAMGSFDVILDDGEKKTTFSLNRSYYGLYVPKMIWREIQNFSTGAVSLVFASLPYDESDYIRDYKTYNREKRINANLIQ